MQQRPARPRRPGGQSEWELGARGTPASRQIASWLRKPQFYLPGLVVIGMILFAFGLQPGTGQSKPEERPNVVAMAPSTPLPSPTAARSSTATATPTGQQNVATADVAGVRGTPPASATVDAETAAAPTQCGTIQESGMALSVQQVVSGVAVAARQATLYPADYFSCILMATGGREAVSLASSVSKATREGATYAVLIDLWITNSGRDFGQVNLRTSALAVAGKTFTPLATLGGRSEVVVASGQGRNVTLVVMVKNGVGATTGPMTLTIDAPLFGGKQTPGKFQLFLPTP